MSVYIYSDVDDIASANTELVFEVNNHRLETGEIVSFNGRVPLPNGFLPNRHYIYWIGRDDQDEDAVMPRLDTEGPPPGWLSAEVISAVRTRIGWPTIRNAINPHSGQPCIWRWIEQRGRKIDFCGNYELFLKVARNPNEHPKGWDILARDVLLPGETITQREHEGPELLIPSHFTRCIYMRGEAARKPGTGAGLSQVSFFRWPLPAWDNSGAPNFFLAAKGYASEEPPGHVIAAAILPISYKPGTGKIGVSIEANTLANALFVGYEIEPQPIDLPEPPPPPPPVPGNDEYTMLFVNRDGSAHVDTSIGGAGSPHAVSSFGSAKIVADHADFDLVDGDFTIRIVASATALSGQMTPAAQWEGSGGTNRAWTSQVNADGSVYFTVSLDNGAASVSLIAPAGTWTPGQHEIGIEREGGTLSMFLDGTLKDSKPIAGVVNNSARAVMLGGLFAQGGGSVNQQWPGTVDHLSIHRIARS